MITTLVITIQFGLVELLYDSYYKTIIVQHVALTTINSKIQCNFWIVTLVTKQFYHQILRLLKNVIIAPTIFKKSGKNNPINK